MKRHSLLLLSALALAACGTTDEAEERLATGCPQVAVVRDLSVYQHPAMADESNLVISVRMGNLRGVCELDDNDNKVDASFEVVAQRGMNTAGRRAAVPFFISVLDAQDQVVKKETYEIPVVFENGVTTKKMNIPVNPTLGVPAGDNPANYRVLIGFQLSPDQVNANTNFFSQIPVVPVEE